MPSQTPLAANWRHWISQHVPVLILVPTIGATLIYVLGFSLWTFWLSLSTSTVLPDPTFAGFGEYAALWKSKRWITAFRNLFLFGSLRRFRPLLCGYSLGFGLKGLVPL